MVNNILLAIKGIRFAAFPLDTDYENAAYQSLIFYFKMFSSFVHCLGFVLAFFYYYYYLIHCSLSCILELQCNATYFVILGGSTNCA